MDMLSMLFGGINPTLLLAAELYFILICIGLGFTLMGLFLDFFNDAIDSIMGAFEGITDLLDMGEGVVSFHGLGGLTVGSFLSSFGAIGLIMTIYLDAQPVISAPISIVSSVIISFVVFKGASMIFTEASISTLDSELIGTEATVIVRIPEGGTGSIQFSKDGIRTICASSNRDIDIGEVVEIIRIVGTKALVNLKKGGS
jgi:membrane protein implicated in regulation of membrane protease activity